jgi:hypothetical protein
MTALYPAPETRSVIRRRLPDGDHGADHIAFQSDYKSLRAYCDENADIGPLSESRRLFITWIRKCAIERAQVESINTQKEVSRWNYPGEILWPLWPLQV